MKKPPILFVMGVSGSGKSTIGKLLAKELKLRFFDGDDFHPKENVDKMAQGHPLNDNDREGWLKELNQLAKNHRESGAVVACSALKHKYRNLLKEGIEGQLQFVFLEGSFDLVSERLRQRKGHFMPPELLRSQFEALEVPRSALSVSIEDDPEVIVAHIVKALNKT
ncbi:gluconokinase [Pseudozobellia thermophila]|uniref:Gluconokinase n=1 Tax=Pseudozobellia thermophila TaxID=192903 RepID=A0A1M6F8Y4_9FLAO|nr:gluconokinase [Pseudozobellia thermophila]SHI94133.1 gluconokinase [Pseudozobellia thermophila]